MSQRVYFVSGVNGVGKSTLIPHLKTLLPADKYAVHDFDARGVPDGADHAWRLNEVRLWLEEAAKADGKDSIVCGFVKPEDFEQIADTNLPEARVILLYADAETIRTRLTGRYTKDGVFDENRKVIGKPVMEFIASNVWYAEKMREECSAAGCPIIDTSSLSPDEVAEQVVQIISKGK
ncbi:MAG: hypothetical protein QOE22_539 [Candidatus Parcubacteria bacterium]|jgi:broad-specificity NMP kinase|nr:hypothetical protein [Candidatus Parcubacteria bacterium]